MSRIKMIKLNQLNQEVLNTIYTNKTVYIYNTPNSTFVATEKDNKFGVLVASFDHHEWSYYDIFGKTTKTTLDKVKKTIGNRYIYLTPNT